MSANPLRRSWLVALLMLGWIGAASAQPAARRSALQSPRVRVDSAYSASLGRTQRFTVLLPVGAERESSRRYPVLYLLHGWAGDPFDWLKLTPLDSIAAPYPLVIVMPDGENGWYVDSPVRPHDQFETYLTTDLPATIAARYPADTSRQALAGLSMGGYGALMIGLRHPDRYRFAGSLSGAISFPQEIESYARVSPTGGLLPSLRDAFGDSTAAVRQATNLLTLAGRVPPPKAPYLYLTAGIQDVFSRFLPVHRALTDSLRAHGLAYEYHEMPGTHSWRFWSRELSPLLRSLAAHWGN